MGKVTGRNEIASMRANGSVIPSMVMANTKQLLQEKPTLESLRTMRAMGRENGQTTWELATWVNGKGTKRR